MKAKNTGIPHGTDRKEEQETCPFDAGKDAGKPKKHVYLDNAATTLQKPPSVAEAVVRAMTGMGNAGRDAGPSSLSAARTVFSAREAISELMGLHDPNGVVFTKNSTEALNIALRGLLKKGDGVVTTVMEHNSVLRPLFDLEQKEGIDLQFAGVDEKGRLCMEEVETLLKKHAPKALVVTHASNVTGNANDLYTLSKLAKKQGARFIVDASQSAGVLPIDMEKMGIDVLCFTGHKSLYGPQGTGGLCVKKGIEIAPLMSGGTGVFSYLRHQPEEMPTRLEAGTLNAHGISGLHAAITYIHEITPEAIHRHEISLMRHFLDRLKGIDVIKCYGDYDTDERAAIVALNIGSYDSSEVADELLLRFHISTRAGAHCAPLLHEALGTREQGMVRFSFSYFNTMEEAAYAADAVRILATE